MKAYDPCHDSFIRYCSAVAYGNVELEDLVQDTLLSAYKNFDRIRQKDQFLFYLIRTARNIAIRRRQRSRYKTESLEAHKERLMAKGIKPEDVLDVHLLYQKINRLPEKQRDGIILFEIIGFSIKEIAEIQKSSEGATKTMLSRARKKLRLLMEEKSSRKKTAVIWPLAANTESYQASLQQSRLFETMRHLPPELSHEAVRQIITELPLLPPLKSSFISKITLNHVIMNAIPLLLVSSIIVFQLSSEKLSPTVKSDLSTNLIQEDKEAYRTLTPAVELSESSINEKPIGFSKQKMDFDLPSGLDFSNMNQKREGEILKDIFSLSPPIAKPLKTSMNISGNILQSIQTLSGSFQNNTTTEVQKEERPISKFHTLITDGLAVVYLSQGETQTATVEVSGMPIEDLITKEADGVLTITTRGNHNGEKIKVSISAVTVQKIEVRGASELYTTDPIKSRNLAVSVIDVGAAWMQVEVGVIDIKMEGGDLTIRGTAAEQKIDYWTHPDAQRGTLKKRGLVVAKQN